MECLILLLHPINAPTAGCPKLSRDGPDGPVLGASADSRLKLRLKLFVFLGFLQGLWTSF